MCDKGGVAICLYGVQYRLKLKTLHGLLLKAKTD